MEKVPIQIRDVVYEKVEESTMDLIVNSLYLTIWDTTVNIKPDITTNIQSICGPYAHYKK